MPIAKVEGPTTSLVFIGTAIDTVRMIAFIPPDKLAEAITDFMLWQTREFASQKQWQSLAGMLEWLTRVVLWGRPHIAQAIRLSTKRRGARASPTFRHEISWWISVLKTNPSVPQQPAPGGHHRDRRLQGRLGGVVTHAGALPPRQVHRSGASLGPALRQSQHG